MYIFYNLTLKAFSDVCSIETDVFGLLICTSPEMALVVFGLPLAVPWLLNKLRYVSCSVHVCQKNSRFYPSFFMPCRMQAFGLGQTRCCEEHMSLYPTQLPNVMHKALQDVCYFILERARRRRGKQNPFYLHNGESCSFSYFILKLNHHPTSTPGFYINEQTYV